MTPRVNTEQKLIDTNGRMDYIDGLKGVAALIVFTGHFLIAFYPFFNSRNPEAIFFQNHPLISFLVFSPLSIFYNGHFAVMIFFVLSGYLLSYKYFLTKRTDVVVSGMVRRYFRLTIPIFFATLLAYGCAVTHLFFNYETSLVTHSQWLSSFYRFTPDFTGMVRFAFFDVYFNYDRNFSYNAPLWVMQFILIGSFVIYALQFLFRYIKKRYVVYLVALVLFYKTYYPAFILGMMLCDATHMQHHYPSLSENKIVLCILFLVGIYLGSYKLHNFWMYGFLDENFVARYYGGYKAIAYNIIGAVLITYVLLHSTLMKRLLSRKSMVFLGRIAFSFYILHFIVLCSLACFLFNSLYVLMIPKAVCVLVTFVITGLVTTVMAQALYNSVEKRTVLFSRQLYTALASRCSMFMKG